MERIAGGLMLLGASVVSPAEALQERDPELVRTAFTVPVTYTQPIAATQFIAAHARGDGAQQTALSVEDGLLPQFQLGVGVEAVDGGARTDWTGPILEARYALRPAMHPAQVTLTWATDAFDRYEAHAVTAAWVGPGQVHLSVRTEGDRALPGDRVELGAAAIVPLGRSLRGILEAAADPSSGGSRRLVPGLVVLAPLGFQVGIALAFDAAGGVPGRTLHIVVTNEARLRAGAGAQPSESRSR